VREVVFEGGVRWDEIQRPDDSQEEIRARVVVDASGQSGLLMHKLNLRVWGPRH
jgi:flavin-dependent dehydrogenase